MCSVRCAYVGQRGADSPTTIQQVCWAHKRPLLYLISLNSTLDSTRSTRDEAPNKGHALKIGPS